MNQRLLLSYRDASGPRSQCTTIDLTSGRPSKATQLIKTARFVVIYATKGDDRASDFATPGHVQRSIIQVVLRRTLASAWLVCQIASLTGCERLSIELLEPGVGAPGIGKRDAGPDVGTSPRGDSGASEDAGGLEGPADAGARPTLDAGVDTLEPPMWVKRAALPVARGAIGVTTAYNGKIHLVGGDVNYEGMTPDTQHLQYDIDTGGYVPRAAAPDNKQWGVCFVSHGRHLYSFGGWNGDGKVMRRYDLATDTWTYLKSCPRSHVYGFACGVIDGVLYVVSGSEAGKGDRITDTVNAYDISSDAWTEKAPFPAKVKTLSGAVIGTRLYVIGRGSSLDVYDATTNTWLPGPSIRRDASNASAVAYGGALYVFGGTGMNTVNRLDFPGPVWRTLPPMSSPRMNVGVAVVANEIHLFGGFDAAENAVATHEALIIP